MSKQKPNREQQEQTSPTSQKNNLACTQPASGLLPRGLLTGEVHVSHSTVAEDRRPSHEQIAILAYHLWEIQGRRAGADRDNWFQAERLLGAESG